MLRRFVVAAGSTIAASLLIAGSAAAQTGVLAGAVFSADSRAGVQGATVTIVGTKLSAVTGKDGRFTIADVPAGDLELRIRRVDFASREDRLRIAAGDTLHAYYELLGPATESAQSARIMIRSPRVTIDGDTVASEFAVTRAGELREPLIIIDGVVLSGGRDIIKDMDPTRIEKVEVIKGDAAREQYGSRAGNGVIMITTKPRPPQD